MFSFNLPSRFEAKGEKFEFMYSFNPCASFTKGTPDLGDCQSDVAVSLFSNCRTLTDSRKMFRCYHLFFGSNVAYDIWLDAVTNGNKRKVNILNILKKLGPFLPSKL